MTQVFPSILLVVFISLAMLIWWLWEEVHRWKTLFNLINAQYREIMGMRNLIENGVLETCLRYKNTLEELKAEYEAQPEKYRWSLTRIDYALSGEEPE